jgi:hypothetical protein
MQCHPQPPSASAPSAALPRCIGMRHQAQRQQRQRRGLPVPAAARPLATAQAVCSPRSRRWCRCWQAQTRVRPQRPLRLPRPLLWRCARWRLASRLSRGRCPPPCAALC